MNKKTIKDIDVRNKTVLVRADFNVPLREIKGLGAGSAKVFEVADHTRIIKTLPTLEYLLNQHSKIVLISHLGRPKRKDPSLSLFAVATCLGRLLKKPVKFISDCIGKEVEEAVKSMRPGEIILLENTRFHPEEEANNPEFAKKLAGLADIFVDDAFATAHRSHASTVGVTKYLPSVAGFLMEKEIKILAEIMENPEHPFIAVIGGAKISTKIGVIENLLKKTDKVLLGGALANTILKAQGIRVGKSLIEEKMIERAKGLSLTSNKLKIPVDVVVANEPQPEIKASLVKVEKIPENQMVLDIGLDTLNLYKDIINRARTVIWNGPMGIFEIDQFARGTKEIAKAIVESKASKIVIGGGETVEAAAEFCKSSISTDERIHISTGGGAMLQFLEGKSLPAIEVLENR